MSKTYIDTLEEVAEEVSQWAIELIENVIKVIAPDGRPFDSIPKSPEEELNDYLKIRGNEQGWQEWLNLQELQIVQQLTTAQVPQEEIALIQPTLIALSHARRYSARMEKMLKDKLGPNEPTDG